MKKNIITLLLVLVIVLAFSMPAYAKGKPDHAGGPDKPSDPPSPVALSVCIDAGHGGSDSGTLSPDGLIKESDLNLDVAFALEELLESNGYTAHMTRESYNQILSNNDRYSFCNTTNATTLISIHHNGSTNQSVDYSLGLYHQGSSKQLATVVGQSVAESFGQAETFRTERFPSGVLIKSDMPSMMSESYFLTNSNRAENLATNYEAVVAQEAAALFAGLESYYQN